jgi:hypothetical protein
MEKFCVRCGARLSEEDKICPNCGMPVEAEAEPKTVEEDEQDTAEIPVIEQTVVETRPQENEEEEKIYVVEKSSWISTFFYILLVLALLLVAAFGYCYFKHPDYIDTAFGYFGVKTNFARNVEIEGTYGQHTPTPSPSASPSASAAASAAAN